LGEDCLFVITFSSQQLEECTVAQVQVLIRSNDPIYELGFRMGASWTEDRFWQQTVASLARYLGNQDPQVETEAISVDRRMQWSQVNNVWQNAGVRTTLYIVTTPVRVPLSWILRRNRKIG
jgi:hypothetical protein